MSLIPADLNRKEGDLLAAMYLDPLGCPPDWATPQNLAELVRRGYVTGEGARWIITADGNTVGASVMDEWYGGMP